jgi:hypothetical protein
LSDERSASDASESGEASATWRPWPGRRWCYAAGAAAALVLAVRSEAGPVAVGSGLACTVVAAVLAVLAGLDLWYGTALAVDRTGLAVGTGPGRVRRIPWTDVERIEATSTSSRGLLRLASLEIDLGEQLLLLSRHRLGTDPVEVALELRRRRPSGPRR